jgi:hypothetical protein
LNCNFIATLGYPGIGVRFKVGLKKRLNAGFIIALGYQGIDVKVTVGLGLKRVRLSISFLESLRTLDASKSTILAFFLTFFPSQLLSSFLLLSS